MKRPTIKQLQNLAFELHSDSIEKCILAHDQHETAKNIGGTIESCMNRGKAHAYRRASKMALDLLDPPKTVKPMEKKP